MAKNDYIKADKVYDLMGLGNTNFVGFKLTGKNSIHKDDKNSYHICVRKDKFDCFPQPELVKMLKNL